MIFAKIALIGNEEYLKNLVLIKCPNIKYVLYAILLNHRNQERQKK